MLAGYEGLKETLGEEHKRTRKALERIIKLYEAWHAAEPDEGHDKNAEEWRAKLPETNSPIP